MPLTILIRHVDVNGKGEDGDGEAILVAPDRCALVRAFALLPPEAFNFQASTLRWIGTEAGGFQSDSRRALEALTKTVDAFFDEKATRADGA